MSAYAELAHAKTEREEFEAREAIKWEAREELRAEREEFVESEDAEE